MAAPQPIWQNKDGSYIYEPMMSVAPAPAKPKPVSKPITPESTGIPWVGVPWIPWIEPILPQSLIDASQPEPATGYTPEAFKEKIIKAYPDYVSEDWRKYTDIDPYELTKKFVDKYPDYTTQEGTPYKDYLPAPRNRRESFIASGQKIPDRGQVWEDLKRDVGAPYRGLKSVGENLAVGLFGAGADLLDRFDGGDPNNISSQMRRSAAIQQGKMQEKNTNKGFIEWVKQGDPASIIETLSAGAGYLATWAKIPLYLMALAQGGNMSLEWEQQGQDTLWDKAIAYGAGGLSSALDRMSGQNVIWGLMKAGVKKQTATTFVEKMTNYLKGLKPSDFEAGTEVVQQGIENLGRSIMGVDYDTGIQQYFEAWLLGKILGKVWDGQQQPQGVDGVETGPENAVAPDGTPFVMEQEPSTYYQMKDSFMGQKGNNEELAANALRPKQTKEKGLKARRESDKIALEGIEQMYSDNRTGLTTADISTMEGGVEAVEQSLDVHGKRIGEMTKSDAPVMVNDIVQQLQEAMKDPKTQYAGPLKSLAEDIVNILGDPQYVTGITIADLQDHLSTIKSKIFSDYKNVSALYKEASGRAVREFIDNLWNRYDQAIESATSNLAGLKKEQKAYARLKKIQKDFADSLVVDKRNIKGGALSKVGSVLGLVELLKNGTLSGIATSIVMKTVLSEMGYAKGRAGSYEALIRNLDREAVDRYQNNPSTSNPPTDDWNISPDNGSVAPEGPVWVTPEPPAPPKGQVFVNPKPWEVLLYEYQSGKMDIKEMLKQMKQLSPEEIAAVPELKKLDRMEREVSSLNLETKQIGELAREDLAPLLYSIRNGVYTAKEIDYIMDNGPKTPAQAKEEFTFEIINAGRILRGMDPLPPPEPKGVKGEKVKKEEVTPEVKKKKERQIRSKGKLAFMDRFDSTNVTGDELYKIAKYAVDNEVEDLKGFMPKPKLRSNTVRGLKKYQSDMEKWGRNQTVGHPFAKAIETAAEDMNMDAEDLFTEIKDLYNNIDSGKVWDGTIDEQVDTMEKDYEAELEKRRELLSLEALAEGTEMRDPEMAVAPEEMEIVNLEELAKAYPTPEAFVEDFKQAVDQDQTKASPEDSALVQSVYDYVAQNPDIQKKYEEGAVDKDILEELWKEVNTPEETIPEVNKTKFTRAQATKYMDDNIKRIMREVKAGKITGEAGKEQMLELQNDMKYLRLGITPEKLKAGKEKLLDWVMEELEKTPSKRSIPMSQKEDVLYETKLPLWERIKRDGEQKPTLKLKRDVIVTTLSWEKAVIDAGEVLKAYEQGGKALLKDGREYIVSKSQYENIKNNSITSEKPKNFFQEFVDNKVEETVKGSYSKETDALYKELEAKNNGKDFDSWKEKDQEEWMEKRWEPDKTKYSNYQLPWGENYKEILIKAPTRPDTKVYYDMEQYDDFPNNVKKIFEKYPDDGELAEKALKKLGYKVDRDMSGDIIGFEMNPTNEKIFQSSHWSEPNVISHLRLNDRTYEGKKVTFMEELQSDWAREARKNIPQELEMYKRDLKMMETAPDVVNREEKIVALKKKIKDVEEGDSLFPTSPLLKNWQELSVKRALKEAVDNNSEYFAWINGDQTSARYSLSTHVENVDWGTKATFDVWPWGTKGIKLIPKESSKRLEFSIDDNGIIKSVEDWTPVDWKGKRLDEVLGKWLADKIMTDDNGTLSGEWLKFGGEWANNLYDKQVKNIVEDLTGAKVEKLDMWLPINSAESQLYKFDSNGIKSDEVFKKSDVKQGKDFWQNGVGWVITDVLEDWRFKAILKSEADLIGREDQYVRGYVDNKKQTFDIFANKSPMQQGIKITPEIKALVQGKSLIK